MRNGSALQCWNSGAIIGYTENLVLPMYFFKSALWALKIWVTFLSLLTKKILFLLWINHLKNDFAPLFTPKSEVNTFQSDRKYSSSTQK